MKKIIEYTVFQFLKTCLLNIHQFRKILIKKCILHCESEWNKFFISFILTIHSKDAINSYSHY